MFEQSVASPSASCCYTVKKKTIVDDHVKIIEHTFQSRHPATAPELLAHIPRDDRAQPVSATTSAYEHD